jgi:plasmid stability protein
MPQLIVRKIEERVVQRLREIASGLGVSVEEAHRRLLRRSLLEEDSPPPSFKEYMRSMPKVGDEDLFERKRTRSKRRIDL